MVDKKNFIGKTLLIVDTCEPKKQFIFEKIAKLGMNVIVLNKSKNWIEPFVGQWIFADTSNHEDCLVAIENFLKNSPKIKIDGVMTICDDMVLLTSKIVDKFGFIGIPFQLSQLVKNKFTFRKLCQRHRIPFPQYQLVNSRADIEQIGTTFHFPVIIKPVYGSSSCYVIKANNQQELFFYYDFLLQHLSLNVLPSLDEGKELMVEEYIDGDEVDIDVLIQDGEIKFISLTDNFSTREPYFIETGQSIPSRLQQTKQEELLKMAQETLKRIGFRNGCFHFEAKLSSYFGAIPIELNMRMGGGDVYLFMKGAWGVDFIEYSILIALGVFFPIVDVPTKPLKHMVGETFMIDTPGIITKMEIDDHLREKSYLEDVYFYKKIGDKVALPPESYDYLGWITVSGSNFEEAEKNLLDAKKLVRYEIDSSK